MKTKNILLIVIIAVVAVLVIAGGIGFYISNQNNAPPIDETPTPTTETPETDQSSSETESSGAQTYNVELKSFSFNPAEITISVGDTIIWTNKDLVSHTVTSDLGNELDSESLSNEETYLHIFNTAGTFSYHCKPHSSMKGKVIVE